MQLIAGLQLHVAVGSTLHRLRLLEFAVWAMHL